MRTALMLMLMTACTSYADVEKENGFRGAQLGSTSAQVAGLVLHKDEQTGDTVYHRPGDDMMWGPAELGSVTYHFWDDHLWMVRVRTGDSKSLLSELARTYGRPPFSTPWQWNAETVRMHFRGSEFDTTATVTIVKLPLEANREELRPTRLVEKRQRDKERASRKHDPSP